MHRLESHGTLLTHTKPRGKVCQKHAARRTVSGHTMSMPEEGAYRLSVYDDSLPQAGQPQNASHFAESRHQGRVDGTPANKLAGLQARVGDLGRTQQRGSRRAQARQESMATVR